jgi:phospholipid/cholesterol/gamma-HCH transport system permease protein
MILLSLVQSFLASIGRSTMELLAATGRIAIFVGIALSHVVRPPFYPGELARQLLRIGYFSLPVVGLTALFTGGALALQIYSGGSRFNAETVVPSIVAIGIVRELGPVLAGLMVAGRVASSIAAELGTMRVTEQIDALTTLSTNPIKYLVVPRILAATLALPALVAVGDVIGILGGYLVGTGRLGFNAATYIRNTVDYLEAGDVTSRPDQGGGLRLHARADGLLPRLPLRPRRPGRRPGDDERRGLRLGADPRLELRADRGLLLSMAEVPRIEMIDVHKAFGANRVLRGVDLDVHRGESLVIIGGSGTGKSVTLKCILGIERPDSGRS